LLLVLLPLFGSNVFAQTACSNLATDTFFVNAIDTNGVGIVTNAIKIRKNEITFGHKLIDNFRIFKFYST
jgi:hypothetical protein